RGPVLLLVLSAACGSRGGGTTGQTHGPSPQSTEPGATAIASSTGPAAIEPRVDAAFQPRLDRCQKDDECAIAQYGVHSGDQLCCLGGCWGTTPGTKAWAAKVATICARRIREGLEPACPPADCPGAGRPVCVNGRCGQRW